MTAYYNEIDPFAAQWLRELINQGHIAPGIVDERSIEDVRPDELSGFTQCHFFAGIGVWSYALRQAGWPDDRPIWTGSCPCQPFSSAGKGGGFNDERHLWPAFYWLIDQCRPDLVLGEQVAGKAGEVWFDAVRTDLEGSGYASGLSVFPACGVGAPHQRKRLYWVGIGPLGNAQGIGHVQRVVGNQASQECPPFGRGAQPGQGSGRHDAANAGEPCGLADAEGERSGAGSRCPQQAGDTRIGRTVDCDSGEPCSLADAPGRERRRRASDGTSIVNGTQAERDQVQRDATGCGAVRGMAAASSDWGRTEEGSGGEAAQRLQPRGKTEGVSVARSLADAECRGPQGGHEQQGQPSAPGESGGILRPGPTNGFWRDADWLYCRDGKWRAVEPGSFPLVDGAAARVGRLRGYGNAIVAQQAQAFIEAVMEGTP